MLTVRVQLGDLLKYLETVTVDKWDAATFRAKVGILALRACSMHVLRA